MAPSIEHRQSKAICIEAAGSMTRWLFAFLVVVVVYVLLIFFALSVKLAYGQSVPRGMLNPAVTQKNIATTICKNGWTETIRPPQAYTEKLKRQQMKALGYTGLAKYEEDHFIPLEIGGHPTNPINLWPEPWTGKCSAHIKDLAENAGNNAVCKGKITLAQARRTIYANWIRCKKP